MKVEVRTTATGESKYVLKLAWRTACPAFGPASCCHAIDGTHQRVRKRGRGCPSKPFRSDLVP
jgi:hypothetical protein